MAVSDYSVRHVAGGFHFLEGPRWHNGQLYFSDFADGKVYVLESDGRAEVVCQAPNWVSGPGPEHRSNLRSCTAIAWLLDTNILSELRRPKPEPKVVSFVARQPLESLYVSVVALAELRFGIELVPDLTRRSELNDWLAHKVRPMFEQRVLPITEDVMVKWRLLVEQGRKTGHTFSQPDLIIAATAQVHGFTIASRDTSDFGKARVPVFNPWIETAPSAPE